MTMKNIQNGTWLIIISLILTFSACKPIHQVVVDHVTETHYVDSIIKKDSICYIPVEVYTDITTIPEALHLETSLAEADCWIDSCFLKGTIRNKQGVQYQYIKETETIYKDSIVEKPTPYPVEVIVEKPLNNKLLTWTILSSLGCLACLIWIFRKPIIKLFV